MLYVYKSMQGKILNEKGTAVRRSHLLFILVTGMLAGLFISRAVLSACEIAFVVVSLFHRDIKKQVRVFFSTPLLWSMSLLFFIPLLSGWWSADRERWLYIIQVKLPLLFLPLGFAGPFRFSKKQWEWLGWIFTGIIFLASVWTMIRYIPDRIRIDESYLKAKAILTPLENDHVRFSWLVSAAVLLSGWMGYTTGREKRWLRTVLWLTAAWLMVFLHIMAARTGLFSLYIMFLLTTGWLITRKGNWRYALLLPVVLILLPVTAYHTFPSFQNRVRFIQYDLGYFREAHYLQGATDALRVISIKAGWELMRQEPLTGTGFGDIASESVKWYDRHYPGMAASDKIIPGSQWVLYGAGSGIGGLLVFIFCMLVPFFTASRNRLLWWSLNATLALSLLFDIGLEVQFGVFIHAFMVLWWWKWMNKENK